MTRRNLQGNRLPQDSAMYVRVVGKIAFVELTRGKTAIIDAEDGHLVANRLWRATLNDGIWYARSGRQGEILMHRIILGEVEDGLVVDHIDGDGLNNRRSNLRTCKSRDNIRNSKKRTVSGANPRSRFKGVTRIAGRDGWRAQIMRDGIKINLGHYPTPELAARAYDMAAREYFGEFARPNFPARRAS